MLRRVCLLVALAVWLGGALPLAAQGKGAKKYAVTTDRAFVVTKEVLVKQGYEVIRIEDRGPDRIVYYRRGNMGKGKGKGPPMKLIIRRVESRVVFVDVPDIVLVDMEMPRMNGLDFTIHLRSREVTRAVPIIMITSRSTDKHRKQAETAGVDVYLTKPFNDDELLRHVDRLTSAALAR